jgi:hypothetical protein
MLIKISDSLHKVSLLNMLSKSDNWYKLTMKCLKFLVREKLKN